jgi:hypothetical protein
MQSIARILQYLARRYMAELSSQDTARANAAEAHGVLRQRRREKNEVDASLRALLGTYRGADGSGTQAGGQPASPPTQPTASVGSRLMGTEL